MRPEHKLNAGFSYMDLKLEYMGTSICMIELSGALAALSDEWTISHSEVTTPVDTPLATNRLLDYG